MNILKAEAANDDNARNLYLTSVAESIEDRRLVLIVLLIVVITVLILSASTVLVINRAINKVPVQLNRLSTEWKSEELINDEGRQGCVVLANQWSDEDAVVTVSFIINEKQALNEFQTTLVPGEEQRIDIAEALEDITNLSTVRVHVSFEETPVACYIIDRSESIEMPSAY